MSDLPATTDWPECPCCGSDSLFQTSDITVECMACGVMFVEVSDAGAY